MKIQWRFIKYIYDISRHARSINYTIVILTTSVGLFISESSLADIGHNIRRDFNTKIAVVDVDLILEHSKAIVHIKKSIHIISEQIQREISMQELALKKDEAKLIKIRAELPKPEFDKLVLSFNQKVSSTQQKMQSKKLLLERIHANAIAQVHENAISLIKDLSQKYGFNIVFPSSQVLFAHNSLNITHEVLNILNDNMQEIKIKDSIL